MMNQFADFAEELNRLQQQHRLRQLIPREHIGVRFVDPTGQSFVNFGSNDYLGLAATRLATDLSPGSSASALVCGWTIAHQQLANKIAELESTESAVLFPSGFAACSGTIATLTGANDWILSDQLNHASLIDGCKMSAATRTVYPHANTDFVAAQLAENRKRFRRVWIVSDSVFSMDGTVAPLKTLCELADQYDATMIVDEAHGTGVLGTNGSGACEALAVKDAVPIRIGTLSKAVGSQGGFVAGPQVVIDYLINRCRPLIYSTSLAPAAVDAAIKAINSFSSQPERRHRVQRLAQDVRDRLRLTTTSELEHIVPIIPIIMGQNDRVIAASRDLANAGFYVPAIRPPTVPENTARLRISLSAAHDDQMIDELLNQLIRFTNP